MRFIGAFFRWLLTMNTVWGLMIVTAFFLTVYKQYTPKVTLTGASLWQDGANSLVIKVFDKDGKARETGFNLAREQGTIAIPDEYRKQDGDKPFLAALRADGQSLEVVWNANTSGNYVMEVNGKEAGKGKLVNLQALTDAALDYAKAAFDLGLKLVSTMVLFLGLLKVGEDSGLVQFVARLLRPFIRFLFPEVPANHPANGAIIMNFTTSILGLGNAATPFGLKAIGELQSLNKHKNVASNSMVILLAWNTAGFAIIPTSMLAVRKAAGCANVLQIIGPCMVAGLVSTITAIVCAKLLAKLPMFSVQAALAEDGETETPAEGEAKSDAGEQQDKKGA
jgi:spore maturation protein A